MELKININEDIQERMYTKYCASVSECIDCCCSVMIGEDYNSCEEKYRDTIFKTHLKDIINKTLKNI